MPWYATALTVWAALAVLTALLWHAVKRATREADPCDCDVYGEDCTNGQQSDSIVVRALGFGARLDRAGVPILPWVIRHLFWGRWQCLIRHSLVCAIPWCFRCDATWDTWEQIPARHRRREER